MVLRQTGKAEYIKKNISDQLDQRPWQEVETEHCRFHDKRHRDRFSIVLRIRGDRIGETIPMACENKAQVKGTYRFFDGDNNGVTEFNILSGHFHATGARISAEKEQVYIAHDTTEFDFKSNRAPSDEAGKKPARKVKVDGTFQGYTQFSILMHSACVVTRKGLYLGMAGAQFFTRAKFKGVAALLRDDESPTRLRPNSPESARWEDVLRQACEVAGDPSRCVHIADREGDIYDFIDAAFKLGTNFLIRIQHDRSTGDGDIAISDEMELAGVRGVRRIHVKDRDGNDDVAKLDIRARRVCINPPKPKRKHFEPLTVTVVYAEERGTPKNRDRIVWKLMTNLPVQSRDDAIERLDCYALRWKIEVFHKAAKSGCNTEKSKLQTAQRLTNFIATNCVVAWRVCHMTMLKRARPDARPEEVLTTEEIEMLDKHVPDKRGCSTKKTLSDYIRKIAILGGYLARKNDGPPGNIVMRRGMNLLMIICAVERGPIKGSQDTGGNGVLAGGGRRSKRCG